MVDQVNTFEKETIAVLFALQPHPTLARSVHEPGGIEVSFEPLAAIEGVIFLKLLPVLGIAGAMGMVIQPVGRPKGLHERVGEADKGGGGAVLRKSSHDNHIDGVNDDEVRLPKGFDALLHSQPIRFPKDIEAIAHIPAQVFSIQGNYLLHEAQAVNGLGVGAFQLEVVDLLGFRDRKRPKEWRATRERKCHLHGDNRLPDTRVRGQHGRGLDIEEVRDEDREIKGEISEIIHKGLAGSGSEKH